MSMKTVRCSSLALFALAAVVCASSAKADPVVFSLTQSLTPTQFAGGAGVGQGVNVSESMTINDFGFYLDLKTAGTLDYFVYDLTTSSVVLAPEAVSVASAPKQWDFLTLTTPLQLNAGNEYIFGVYDPNAVSDYMTVNLDPVGSFTSDGLTAGSAYDFSGDKPTGPAAADVSLQIESTDPPATTPEPSSLLLLGTGILATAGAMRKKFMR